MQLPMCSKWEAHQPNNTHAANEPVIVVLWGRMLLGCVRCVTQSQETHCVTDFSSRVTGYLYVVNEPQGNEAWLACSQQTVWSASSKLGLEWKRMASRDGRVSSGPSLVYKPKLFRWHLKRLLLNSERQPGEDVRCGPFRGNSGTNIDICTSQKVTLLFRHMQLSQVISVLLIPLGTYKQKEIWHLLFWLNRNR